MGCQFSMQMGKNGSFENAIKFHSSSFSEARARMKIIVLGTSNSGKSTLLRQMQLIKASGFTDLERQAFMTLVSDNIIQALHVILQKTYQSNDVFDEVATAKAAEDFELLYKKNQVHSHEEQRKLVQLGVVLWGNQQIRAAFDDCKNCFENGESLLLLFSSISEIARADYLPSDRDILNCRMRSTGIKTLQFDFDEIPIEMIDVGGQRSERRKWIHYFDNVEVVLFCVSVNEYDMNLVEDSSKNAMEESLEMFESIINSVWFKKKPIILFLNKVDLLEKKLKSSSCLRDCFPEFSGDENNFSHVLNFIKDKYLQCDKQKGRQLFPFQTCATDTSNIEKVVNVCFHVVFRETLVNIGL